jgi:hypothetical protein
MGRKLRYPWADLQVCTMQFLVYYYTALYTLSINPKYRSYLGASAIYLLHLAPYLEKGAKIPSPVFELHRTTRIIIDIARAFCISFLSVHGGGVSRSTPLTLHSLYNASLVHIELAEESFQSEEWESDFKALTDMITFIRGRWALAGMPACHF